MKFKKIFGKEKDDNIFDVNVKTGTARILKTEIAAVVYHENGADIHMKSGTIFQVIKQKPDLLGHYPMTLNHTKR